PPPPPAPATFPRPTTTPASARVLSRFGGPPAAPGARTGAAGGRDAAARVCATAHRVRPRGMVLMVHCELCGVAGTTERLSALGMKARAVNRAQGPFRSGIARAPGLALCPGGTWTVTRRQKGWW
ncbi:hypothetical protein ACFRLW_49095, partial [Streptomyces sp. NPDC056728]